MIDELKKLRELTETLTGNGYLMDQAEEWEYALDAMPDYVYIIDVSYKIKFVNRLLSERLSKPKQELYDKFCYKEIDHKTSVDPTSLWKDDDPHKPIKLESVHLNNMDGWFDITRSPIITRAGRLIGFICVLQDVTEKRRVLLKLQEIEQKYKIIVESLREVV